MYSFNRLSLLSLSVVLISLGFMQVQAQNNSYRLCIPSQFMDSCEQMQKDANPDSQKIKCVPANDKIDCIEKIIKNEADFLPLEPEEIYVAHRFDKDGFFIVSEIRSAEFPNRDYRYEPVAVIRKSSGINSISDLQGKRSCHTGYSRNAGWKIPFSHLMDKNELPKYCDAIKAPSSEKDLYAISNYFGAACAPGIWIPEPVKDKELKERYPNLCSLCDNPGLCDRADKYGGYEGALKCLTMNNGDIAWTKMDSVQKFFQLNSSSTQPIPIAKDYAFLCWDGSSAPLTSSDPCSWARRPWRAFLASSRLSSSSVGDLQEQITHFRTIALEQAKMTNIVPSWLSDVLEFDTPTDKESLKLPAIEFHNPPHMARLTSPGKYLSQKNYTVTIEKPSCAIKSTIKFCVRSELERLKCTALKLASMGRRILPALECILGEGDLDCIQKVKNGEADVVNLDPKDASWAQRNYGLVAILSELERTDNLRTESGPYRYAIGVIRAESAKTYRNISDLRGKSSCHGSIKSLSGWNAVLTTLRNVDEIHGQTCGLSLQMGYYFGNKSCVPGIPEEQSRMSWLPQSFCSLCAGDGEAPGKAQTPETLCGANDAERYFGNVGALRCLADGIADIAFTDHVSLAKSLAENKLKEENLRLLCPKGTITMNLDHFVQCNWGKIPSRKIMSRGGDESRIQREDSRLTLLKASDTFAPGSKNKGNLIFNLFGSYYGNNDLLFQDTSIGLCDEVTTVKSNELDAKYFDKLISDFDYCTTSNAPGGGGGWASKILVVFSSFLILLRFI